MSIKRNYDASAQHELKALTHKKVMEAVLILFMEKWIDEITLKDVAQRAGVTVQTLIRHFGSRENLLLTAVQELDFGADSFRDAPLDGDLTRIVKALFDYYEKYGPLVLRCVAQEHRIPELDSSLKNGRNQHRNWIRKVFSSYLLKTKAGEAVFLENQLYAMCEVYLWRIYRIDLNLSREELEQVWLFQLKIILEAFSSQNGRN